MVHSNHPVKAEVTKRDKIYWWESPSHCLVGCGRKVASIALHIFYLPRRRRPGTGDIASQRPPSVCLYVRLSVRPSRLVFAYLNHNITKRLYMGPSTEEEIMKILLNITNSSPGHDGINIKVLKAIKEYIIAPLTHLCNISLITGKVPNELKIAKVIPMHKKGKQNVLGSYRPIFVLPAVSKVYERLVCNRIFKFIDDHNILYNHQFGFKKNHSTYLAINALVTKFHESAESSEFMLGLFIDLSRAFDTISHKILLDKLYKYGIRGIALEWVRDYLSNRKQFVVYNNANSYMGEVDIGVPQGSILRPLPFLLYVNDLSNVSMKLSFIQFADDRIYQYFHKRWFTF